MNLKEASDNLKSISERPNITEQERTELYETCLTFSQYFFSWKKVCSTVEIYEQVTVIAAEQLYLEIMSGKRRDSWLRYVNKGFMEYFDIWQQLYGFGDPKHPTAEQLEKNYIPFVRAHYCSPDSSRIIEVADISSRLWDLYKELNSYLRICNRFSSPVALLNARISIQLSVKYGRFVNFRLFDVDAQICRFLYNKFQFVFRKLTKSSSFLVLSDEKFAAAMGSEIYVMNGLLQEYEEGAD